MTSPYLVKGILLKDIIVTDETNGDNNEFINYYEGDNSLVAFNLASPNHNSMKPRQLGYYIDGDDFNKQCLARYSFITSGTSIEVPRAYNPINGNNVRAKHYNAILVGSSGGQGGTGGGAGVKVNSGKTIKANGGIGGLGGFGTFDTTTNQKVRNDSFNYEIGIAGTIGNKGNKSSKNTSLASDSKAKGSSGGSGNKGGATNLDDGFRIHNANGGNGGNGGGGGTARYNGSNYLANNGNAGTTGNTNHIINDNDNLDNDRNQVDTRVDYTDIEQYGNPSVNQNGAIQIIWLWDQI